MFQIEKNVPMPAERSAYTRYPFADMKVGDSFVSPKEMAKKARTASWNWAKENGVKFATRGQSDGSVRIWRIS